MVLGIENLVAGSYGNSALFFLVLFASFFPVPVMGWIIASIGASINNTRTLIPTMFLLYIAATLGDILVYFIAQKFSNKVMLFLKQWKWFKKGENHAHRLYKKYGFFIVFISRFLNTELCVIINYISGLEKYNYRKFIIAVIIGEFLYIFGYMTFGYIFKETWIYLSGIIQSVILKIILVCIGVYIIYRILRRIIPKCKSKK